MQTLSGTGSSAPSAVSVVVVTFNSGAVVADCLESVAAAFPGVRTTISVADNASTDDTVRLVADRFPHVNLVQLPANQGFAAGINAVAAAAPSDQPLLVLNPDVRLAPGSGLPMLQALNSEGVGIVVPRLIDDAGNLQHSLRRPPSIRRAWGTALLGGRVSQRFGALSEVVASDAEYTKRTTAAWATGAAMLISAECRRRVGAWDQSYFLYSEETDYCLRARAEGLQVVLEPRAEAVHIGGESTTSPVLWSILVRNRVTFYRRTHGAIASALYWMGVTTGELIRALGGSRTSRAALVAVISRRPKHTQLVAARDHAPGWVCFAAQDWWYHNHGHSDFQLMTRLAKDRTVLLVNSIGMRMPTPGRSPMFLRRILRKARSTLKGLRTPIPERPRFHVLSPVILPFYGSAAARRVNRGLVSMQVAVVSRWLGIRRPVVMVTIPTAWGIVAKMDRSRLLFNRSDKHSSFGEVDTAYIASLEHELLCRSDTVMYVSHALMDEDAPSSGDRSYFLDHGVDLDHFTHRPSEQIPDDLGRIPAPRIGFFGGIDDYVVDLELLGKVAKQFPHASLVLIGDATCPLDDLRALPNVHLLGPRPYADIPRYGSGFDVALMPWLDNEWIKSCNPIKVKEYLALGLPVVTTWYPEVARYESVASVATSHDEFLAAVAEVLDGRRPASAEMCRAAVADASWDVRTDQLRQLGEV